MIELRTKKIVKEKIISILPELHIKLSLKTGLFKLSDSLFNKLNLTDKNIGFGIDRENNKVYTCSSESTSGIKVNNKTISFSNKSLMKDLLLWFNLEKDKYKIIIFKIEDSTPIIENSIEFFEVSIYSVSKLVNQTEIKQLEESWESK